jgi:hypothetical protein
MREVYLPVVVTIVEDGPDAGAIAEAYIDFEGAPWMYALSEANVWNPDTEEWERDGDLEQMAMVALNTRLEGPNAIT